MMNMQARQENVIIAAWQFAAILLLVCLNIADQACAVGVAYGRVGDNLPSPQQVATLLQSNGFKNAMIYDTDPQVLQAFMGSGISLIVQATNSELQGLAASPGTATQWVQNKIVPYSSIIKYISVGNEVLTGDPGNSQYLLPAMNNINQALASAGGLQGSIKVSTTHATSVLGASYPPSQGRFQDSVQAEMASILQFLRSNGAPFMANVYPFFAYIGSSRIDLRYALGEPGSPTVTDSGNGLQYKSLFDAQVDALLAAMDAAGGYGDVGIMVTESGWPSAGNSAATVQNAKTYVNNLIAHQGTPKRPSPALQAYIFALFNENQKSGPEYERHFGLFNPDQTKVYDFTI